MKLLESLKEHYESKATMLDPSIEKAFIAFEKMGIPTSKDEAFRYTKLTELGEIALCRSNMQEEVESSSENTLVFVDGVLQKCCYRKTGVVVSSIEEALKSHGALLRSKFSSFIKLEKDPFALLNHALFEEGAFIYIPPDLALKEPLTFEFRVKTPNAYHMPKIMLFLGRSSAANLRFKMIADEEGLSSRYLEIHQEKNSQLTIINDLQAIDQLQHFDSLRAFLKQDAKLKYLSIAANAQMTRQSLEVKLLEEGADATLKGLSVLDQKEQSHVHVLLSHLAENCTSNQHFKSVLLGSSRSSFEGKIFVDSIAQKTLAYQLFNALVLSDSSHAFSKPNLEIFADDVKASHGATITQLKEKELFYLKSRGLDRLLCQKLLTKGFCKEPLDGILSAQEVETILNQLNKNLAW